MAFLLDLSLTIRALYIEQEYTKSNYFFGTKHADWGSIIVEMFARNLDKLRIENRRYSYIDNRSADLIRQATFSYFEGAVKFFLQKIPHLGKKVWLSLCCDEYPTDFNYTLNEHSVKIGYDGYTPSVRIVHVSREGESDGTCATF